MTNSRAFQPTLVLAASLATGLALTGCGGESQPATPSAVKLSSAAPSSVHNAADIAFAQLMIPHHEQAVRMANFTLINTKNPKILALGTKIEQAQPLEITTMTGWLKAWGQPVTASPTTSKPMAEMGDDMGHDMSDSGGDMPGMKGMLTFQQLKDLANIQGAAFDRMFLELMIVHHQGAVEMAKTELSNGASPAAKALAATIIKTQEAEITEMKTLLGGS